MNLLSSLYGSSALNRAPNRTLCSWVFLLPVGLLLSLAAAMFSGVRPVYDQLHAIGPAALEQAEGGSRVEGSFLIEPGGKGLFYVCLAAPPQKHGRLTHYCPWVARTPGGFEKLSALKGKAGYGFKRKGSPTTLVSLYQSDGSPVVSLKHYEAEVNSSYKTWVALRMSGYGFLSLSLLLQISQLSFWRKLSSSTLNVWRRSG